eukprot:4781727-Prymnesium_polylepis.1
MLLIPLPGRPQAYKRRASSIQMQSACPCYRPSRHRDDNMLPAGDLREPAPTLQCGRPIP